MRLGLPCHEGMHAMHNALPLCSEKTIRHTDLCYDSVQTAGQLSIIYLRLQCTRASVGADAAQKVVRQSDSVHDQQEPCCIQGAELLPAACAAIPRADKARAASALSLRSWAVRLGALISLCPREPSSSNVLRWRLAGGPTPASSASASSRLAWIRLCIHAGFRH